MSAVSAKTYLVRNTPVPITVGMSITSNSLHFWPMPGEHTASMSIGGND